jgi:hypothetical protein
VQQFRDARRKQMSQFPAGKTADLISAGTGDTVAMNGDAAIITTKSLTTAALTAYNTFVVNCSLLKTTTIPIVELANGSNTQGVPLIATVTPTATQIGPGSLSFVIFNAHASQALNGTLQVFVLLIN